MNELLSSVLALLDALFNLGVYNQDGTIEKLLPSLISVLDGRSCSDQSRFIRDENSGAQIDTKSQICKILNKVMEWRLKKRVTKAVSLWKSDYLSGWNGKQEIALSNGLSIIVSGL